MSYVYVYYFMDAYAVCGVRIYINYIFMTCHTSGSGALDCTESLNLNIRKEKREIYISENKKKEKTCSGAERAGF